MSAGPQITGQSPAQGTSDVDVDATISFSLTDDVQVILSTIQVYVNGALVFNSGSFQSGWGGSTCTANAYQGWDFVLRHSALFSYTSTIPVRVIAQDADPNTLDTSWFFNTIIKLKKANIQIVGLSVEILRVFFPEPAVTSADLTLLSNYFSTTLTDGAQDVSVLEVRNPDPEAGTVEFVDVYISPVGLQALYRLEVRNQRTGDGLLMTSGAYLGMIAHFMGRATKIDSMRSTLGSMYAAGQRGGTGSTMFQVMAAMGIEDENIGGESNLSPIPVPVPPPTTFGTSTYGTNTYGG